MTIQGTRGVVPIGGVGGSCNHCHDGCVCICSFSCSYCSFDIGGCSTGCGMAGLCSGCGNVCTNNSAHLAPYLDLVPIVRIK